MVTAIAWGIDINSVNGLIGFIDYGEADRAANLEGRAHAMRHSGSLGDFGMGESGQGADFSVSHDQVAAFQRDGYLIVPGLFSEEETGLIRETMEQDPVVRGSMFDRTDATGAATKAVVWLEPGESTYGLVARVGRVAKTMSALLGHEVYHYQAKLTAKEPRKGGAWEWHQDFGYWYEQNCLYPDMGSMMLALDASNRENGGLQVLSGSHRMGLMRHVFTTGGQYCVDPDRLREVEKVADHVHCELEPGDALFFHCNTLHRSDQNRSEKRRWTLLACYNTKHNSPFKTVVPGTPYRPLDIAPDSAIMSAGVRFASGEEQFQTKYVEEQKKAAGFD